MGNKYKLLEFIRKTVDENCEGIETVADIFAGTGAVGLAFEDKELLLNDNLRCNSICHRAFYTGTEDYTKVETYINTYNNLEISEDTSNYMTENFADTYFTRKQCAKIGYIREDLQEKLVQQDITESEFQVLLASLLYAVDAIAHTCGHYDAYRKGKNNERELEMRMPQRIKNVKTKIFNVDANTLINYIKPDLLYLDPPYNSRQYCDYYHILENIAWWTKPPVSGKAKKLDRSLWKSNYSTTKAIQSFEKMVKETKAKYILLSYNNMGNKGVMRSNATMTDEDIMRVLTAKGEVKVFSKKYRAFNVGNGEREGNEERLFLCKCNVKED